jgi:hypothetical protein
MGDTFTEAISRHSRRPQQHSSPMRTLHLERQTVQLEAISDPKSVSRLEISLCKLPALDGIHRFTELREIHIHYCRSLTDLSQLMRLPRLRGINLFCLPNVKQGLAIPVFRDLELLSYNNVRDLASIRGIGTLKKLSYLGLSRVKVLDGDYRPIVDCKSLKRVFWHGAPFKPPAMQEIKKLRPDILIGGNCARPSVPVP